MSRYVLNYYSCILYHGIIGGMSKKASCKYPKPHMARFRDVKVAITVPVPNLQ